jgi:hypothetical protein
VPDGVGANRRGAFSATLLTDFLTRAAVAPSAPAAAASSAPAAKANARGSDKGCGIGVKRGREIITGEFRSA